MKNGYNSRTKQDGQLLQVRNELTSATKTGGPAAVPATPEYAYQYDDIGNRITSTDLTTNRTYTANSLNQYSAITTSDLGHQTSSFAPQFDDDGNQTLIKTSTGIWSVTYNGENRPILWKNVSPNSSTPNSHTPSLITMSFDRMGRRVAKNDQLFVCLGYLQVADNSGNTYIWDPTEPIATRPLVWNREGSVEYYIHDGNKNLSEVVASDCDVTAHYEYAPFGAVVAQNGEDASINKWRFSSECADDVIELVYYNYRHYEQILGRWLRIDPAEIRGGVNLFEFTLNQPLRYSDILGLLKNDVEVVVSPVLPMLQEKCNHTNERHEVKSAAPHFVIFRDHEWRLIGAAYVPLAAHCGAHGVRALPFVALGSICWLLLPVLLSDSHFLRGFCRAEIGCAA